MSLCFFNKFYERKRVVHFVWCGFVGLGCICCPYCCVGHPSIARESETSNSCLFSIHFISCHFISLSLSDSLFGLSSLASIPMLLSLWSEVCLLSPYRPISIHCSDMCLAWVLLERIYNILLYFGTCDSPTHPVLSNKFSLLGDQNFGHVASHNGEGSKSSQIM